MGKYNDYRLETKITMIMNYHYPKALWHINPWYRKGTMTKIYVNLYCLHERKDFMDTLFNYMKHNFGIIDDNGGQGDYNGYIVYPQSFKQELLDMDMETFELWMRLNT